MRYMKMAKDQKKKYESLQKKIEGVDSNFSDPIKEKYQELKNIYQGKSKEGKKKGKLHLLKNRYQAAEEYQKTLGKEGLTEAEKGYLYILATEFTKYDTKLDKKRKNTEYKKQVKEKRDKHAVNTLESVVQNTPTVGTIVAPKESNNLETYVKQEEKPKEDRATPLLFKLPDTPIEYRDGITPTPARAIRTGRRTRPNQDQPGLLTRLNRGIKKHRYKILGGLGALAVATWLGYSCSGKVTINQKDPENIGKKDYIEKISTDLGAGKGGWEATYKEKPVIQSIPRIVKPKVPKVIPKVPKIVKPEEAKPETIVVPEIKAPKSETKIVTEKNLTDLMLNGGIDFSKYEFSFSGTENDPEAIVFYEKGNDNVMFNRALGGPIWEKIGSPGELKGLVNAMQDYNDRHVNFPLKAEFIKNKDGKNVGFSFTDFPYLMINKHKDGSVLVHDPERGILGDGTGTSGTGTSGGGSGSGGQM